MLNLGHENEKTEFKKSTGEHKEGIISIGSILNKHGEGTLYFGVLDNGEIIGQDVTDATIRDLANQIDHAIVPKISPVIEKIENPGKNNYYIKISFKGKQKPYSVYDRYYIRVADVDKKLSLGEIVEMAVESNHLDLVTLVKSKHQDLTFNELKHLYLLKGKKINDNQFEKNLDLFTPEGEYNQMAYLLADHNDVSIKVVKFNGNNKTVMSERNEFGNKCLLDAYNDVINYVKSQNATMVKLTPEGRQEETLFNMDTFRESWLNACEHSKWIEQIPPIVYIYNNRIEIISHGGLPEGLSLVDFYKGVSHPVNEKLQSIFGQLDFAEQTGHGIPTIVDIYGKKAFEIEDNLVTVTIPFSRVIDNSEVEFNFEDLNESENKIYSYLHKKNNATLVEIQNKFNLSRTYVKLIISSLKNKGYIKRNGSNRNGYWECLK